MDKESVNNSDKIQGSSIAVGWLLDSLSANDEVFIRQCSNKTVSKVTSFDANGGTGLISMVLRCKIHFSDDSEPYSTVLKIPGTSAMERAAKNCSDSANFLTESFAARFPSMHQTECDFYSLYSSKFTIPLPRVFKTQLWIPQTHQDGCIHMEDLTDKGRLMFPFKSVNMAQIKEMTRYLAQMHRVSLTMDKKWRGRYLKNQTTFGDMVQMITSNIGPFLERGKSFEHLLGPLVHKYRKLMGSAELINYAHGQAHVDLGLEPVMVHGDLWLGNIVWQTDQHGDIVNHIAAVIDWQIMHEGNPMADLARFLISCADGVVRREAEAFIVQFYLEHLEELFKKDKLTCPYSLEQLQQAYDVVFVAMGFMLIPASVITVNNLDPAECSGRFKQAAVDVALVRALHSLQDIDRLLSESRYRHLFEKYGL